MCNLFEIESANKKLPVLHVKQIVGRSNKRKMRSTSLHLRLTRVSSFEGLSSETGGYRHPVRMAVEVTSHKRANCRV